MGESRKPGRPGDTDLIQMVHDLLYGRHPAQQFGGGGFRPHIDVMVGTEDAWIQVELPGVATKDIRVSVRDRQVEIAGMRRARKYRTGVSFVRVEIEFGSFHRTVELPWSIDADRVQSRHQDGVLDLHVFRHAEPASITESEK